MTILAHPECPPWTSPHIPPIEASGIGIVAVKAVLRSKGFTTRTEWKNTYIIQMGTIRISTPMRFIHLSPIGGIVELPTLDKAFWSDKDSWSPTPAAWEYIQKIVLSNYGPEQRATAKYWVTA